MARIPNISAGVLVILAVAALTAAAVAIVRIGGEGESPQEVGTPAPVATPAPAKPAQPAQPVRGFHDDDPDEEIPSLTENQIEEVKSLLSADRSLKALLAGESYTIRNMGPWTGSDREFIGALVDVKLDSPVSYDGLLPSRGGQTKWRAEGIESLDILVDLNRGEVASIAIWEAASASVDFRYEILNGIRYLITR